MTIMFEQPSLISGAKIPRFRFITMNNGSATNTGSAVETLDADAEAVVANTGDPIIGITTGASQDAPQDSASSLAAKEAGVSFEWISAGAMGLLTASKAWVRGDMLMANTNSSLDFTNFAGAGEPVADGNWIGAMAMENAAQGEEGRVLVQPTSYFENT